MKKYIICLFTVLLLSNCSYKVYTLSVYKEINQAHNACYETEGFKHNIPINSLTKARRIALKELSDIVDIENVEQFFIVEAYSIENGDIIGRIWNNDFDLRYGKTLFEDVKVNYPKDSATSVDYQYFDDENEHMISLIENWDEASIKRHSENSKILGGFYYFASNISNKDGNLDVKCISFYEFR